MPNDKVATLVLLSKNVKIGDVSATYASIDGSCPSDCAHKGAGCYAQSGNVGIHVARLNAASQAKGKNDARAVARAEAREIKSAIKAGKDIRPLRIHVSGDCRTPSAASEIAKAVEGWKGGPVWSYTHGWKKIARKTWGKVSVLASVDKAEDIGLAFSMGYAPAIVVSNHPEDGKAFRRTDGVKVIPCPAQTRDLTCTECKLCMNADMLHSQRAAISFAAHGVSKRKLKVIK
jgi:hypothetical protein